MIQCLTYTEPLAAYLQTLTYLVLDNTNNHFSHMDSYYGAVVDETVDLKAVKARFRHELGYSE